MNIKNLNIGTRLGLGFGLLILMLLGAVAVAFLRLSQVEAINTRIIEKEWVKAEAANVINATTRANARRTMELLIVDDQQRQAAIKQHIADNKKTIDVALETLEQQIYLPEGKALLAQLKEARGKYVASFSRVVKLVETGNKEEATRVMNGETLPLLDALQAPINQLTDLQQRLVASSSVELDRSIRAARMLMLGLGVTGLVFGLLFAWWVTRSITRPLSAAVEVARTVASGDLGSEIRVETRSGVIAPRLRDDGLVTVDMGVPQFAPDKIPFVSESDAFVQPLEVGDRTVAITAVSMGNPHAVQVVADVDTAPVAELGALIERHERFPARVNAGFLEVVDPGHARLRVFERGAGETLACGTGACAAVVAGIGRGLLVSPVKVETRGGELEIAWAGPGSPVLMTGPAVSVFEAEMVLD